MLEDLREQLRLLCVAEKQPVALWLSGGKDSLLLLLVALSARLPFSILRFDDGWTREQKRIVGNLIEKHKLQVFSYRPLAATVIGNSAGEVTLVCDYAVTAKGDPIAVLRDFVDEPGNFSRCAFDLKLEKSTNTPPPVLFRTHLLGSKKGEKHYAFAQSRDVVNLPSWKIGTANFHAPLYDLTDSDVIALLAELGVNYTEPPPHLNTGNLPLCHECLKGTGKVFCPKEKKEIDSHEWNPQQQLANWREKLAARE
jgi:3'-phosphoadenosine 5'-phosphosulfate sulfotransferase (PAPS reductase)/FAD synthetase